MSPQKTHELTEFEQQFKFIQPADPSPNFYSIGMEILSAKATPSFLQWRHFVTGVLVAALAVSLSLNFIQFRNAPDPSLTPTNRQTLNSPDLMASQASSEMPIILSPPINNELEERYVLGEDFILIDAAILGEGDGRLQVSNFFWYGCNYCFSFEKLVGPWQSKHSAEINLNYQRIPAVWSGLMLIHARAFYAAMEFPNAEAIHQTLFNALHVNRDAYISEQTIAPLFSENGIDYAGFAEAFNAPRTILLADSAHSLTKEMQSLGLNGVPGLIVNRRYLVKNTKFERMLKVADYLIQFEQDRSKQNIKENVVVEFAVDPDGSVLSVELGQLNTRKRSPVDKTLNKPASQNGAASEIF